MDLALPAEMVEGIEASKSSSTPLIAVHCSVHCCQANSRQSSLSCIDALRTLRCDCCCAGFWPTYKSMDLALPAEMVEGIEAFKEFYEAETKHRKLTWVYTQVGFRKRSVLRVLCEVMSAVVRKSQTINLTKHRKLGMLCLCVAFCIAYMYKNELRRIRHVLLLLLLLQGTAVLKGNFDIKSLELVLSTLQVRCTPVQVLYPVCFQH
jgi:hypothetical protein